MSQSLFNGQDLACQQFLSAYIRQFVENRDKVTYEGTLLRDLPAEQPSNSIKQKNRKSSSFFPSAHLCARISRCNA